MLNSRFHSLLFIAFTMFLCAAPGVARGASDLAQDVKVAVLPFAVNAGDDLSYLKDSFPELLADQLREAGFVVVDNEQTKQLMAEKGYEDPSVNSARDIAVLAGADFSVFGALNQIGDDLTIDARLVDATKQTPGKKISVTKEGLINLLPAVDELVDKMKMDLLRVDIISEVDVEGTKVLDKDVVLMRLTLQKSDMLTAKSVNTALKNIYDLGYFDDVEVKVDDADSGKKVVFVVTEKPRIQAIGVEGADAIDSEDILEAVSTKKGGVINPKVLSDDIRVIREMYRKEGYYKAKVSHNTEEAGNGVARLTYVIDEGPKLYIEHVVIDGAKQMDPDDIRDVLSLKERGWLSWLDDSGVLKEELLERDASAIQAFYNSKGFIDVKVGRPEVKINDTGIDVIYQVWEGDRYKMGDTSFKGDLIADTDKLLEVTDIDRLKAEDEYFDRTILKNDTAALTDYYNDYGYAYADVGVNLKDDRENKIVNVVYTISKHQRVHIRRVLLEGNTVTRDNVIMREMRLADGDRFNGSKLKRSYQRLNNLNYFEKVDIAPVPTGNPDEMDLVVKVKDKSTGRIGGGIGYSTYENVYLVADITETNLFGKGYSFGVTGSFSGTTTAFSATFRNPHVNDTDLGYGIELFNRDEEFNDYDKSDVGATVDFSYPIGEFTKLRWNYTIDNYKIKDVASDAAQEVKDDAGTHLLSQLEGAIIRDTRDTTMNTSSGTITKLGISYAGGVLGGTDEFIKYTGTYEWYSPLFEEVIFHSKVWGGFIHRNFGGDRLPTAERFELGGIGSVRGYSRYSISPLDSSGSEIGGTKAVYLNLELRRTLSKEMGLGSLVFFDAGNSWKESEMFMSSPTRHGTSPTLSLYKAVGAGINWYSPMGPVGIVYGYGLDRIGSTGRHKFELTMGQQF